MIFSLLVILIQSHIKICVCHKRCSSLCNNNFINATYNSSFKDFLLNYLDKDNELELNFYSEEDNFSFELDLSNFANNNIILKNFINSKPINVVIMNDNLIKEKISINPNNQVLFPKLKINNLSQFQSTLIHKDTYESNTKQYDDIDGLINVTCEKLHYISDYSACYNGPYAVGGSYLNPNGKLDYKFNGTKIYVVAYDNQPSAEVRISIDGIFISNACPNNRDNSYPVVLESDYYAFGEHTISIEHTGGGHGAAFFINSLLVDPLPKVGGHKLGFSDIKSNNGWTLDNSLKTPFFKSSTSGSSFEFKFHGTRFWLTGIRDNNYGKCKLFIDDRDPIIIDGRIGIDSFVESASDGKKTVPVRPRANGNQGVLFHESDVLEFKDHTIRIEKIDSKEFRIINLLYTTQPYNAIVVPSKEIKFEGNWIEESEGYSTNSDGSRCMITEYLNHIWIIGNKLTNNQALMNIYYNDEKEENININDINTIFTNEILFKSLSSISHDTYSIQIEKTSNPTDTSNSFLHISYFYYLNEKTFDVHKDALSFKAKDADKDGWNEDNEKLFSETKGASITFNSIPFCQFWIVGDVDPNYGIIEIYIDDQYESNVSLYNEKHESNIVIYESPMNKVLNNHKITIKNHDTKRVCIFQVQYIEHSGYNKEYNDLEGLINITCDNFNYIEECGWCSKSGGAMGGSFVSKNGKLDFKFNGTRIHIVSYDQNNERYGGIMQITIDGKVAGTACPNRKSGTYQIVFSSDYYPFGEHTVLIEHIGGGSSFYINSLLVDPLPKVGGHKLGFSDIKSNNGWTLDNSLKTPFFKSSTSGSSFEFKFHGTRFWLTGIRDNNYGKCKLFIDDRDPIIIDGRIGIDSFVESASDGKKIVPVRSRANGNQGVLFHESDVLEFKDHTIRIEKIDSKEFRIINLLYTTQPYNAIVVPSKEIKFEGNWIEESEGYSTNSDGSRCMITEYLNHIWIIGNKLTNNQALMNIYYNDEKEENININDINTIFTNEILFKSLSSISHDTYSIQIEKTSNPTDTSNSFLHISYFYYLNEKTINVEDESHKIDINEMENNKNGTWERSNDNIITDEKDASISVEFFGNKFWIYGTVDPNYGTIDIIFDGQKQSHVSLYNERHISNLVLYESPEANSQDVHSLKLVNQKKTRISIYQIVYQVLPSTQVFSLSDGFTNSKYFSNTDSFTRTDVFSRTTDFTKSSYFSGTRHFTETNEFSKTNDFTKTKEFSKTNDFTKTKDFTRTSNFSRSGFFSSSGHFSETNKFSPSKFFSGSEQFSETAKFSGTNEFTRTGHFSNSYSFSETDKFSRTNNFTFSGIFSSSLYFSESDKFSQTNFFSKTTLFTRTGIFTNTDHFTQSSYFSKSSIFSKSPVFTQTQGFSQSFAISPSLPLENGDYCLYESQEKNYTTGDCNFTIDNQNDVIIRVILTNFTNYIEEHNGGAIYINNGGLDCTSISFTHCVSIKGGGGAIYIKNTLDLLHNITLDNVSINKCQAQFGGGCYIYSQSEENNVLIIRSNFSENIASLKKQTNENKNLFGGSHIFITTKNLNVSYSLFTKGVHDGVKIYNVFDQSGASVKNFDEVPNNIFISGCNFEHENDSGNSINLVDTKSDSKIKLIECRFAGKIAENSHYIIGKVVSKDANNIKLISCNFEYNNKMAMSIDALNEKDLLEINEHQISSNLSGLNSLGILMILFSIALIIITLIFLVISLSSKRQFNFDDTTDELEDN